jgi:predicted RNase H-like HicB family nuclease
MLRVGNQTNLSREIDEVTSVAYFIGTKQRADQKNQIVQINPSKQCSIPRREVITMIFEYCEKAIEKAEYKKLEDGTWFAEVPGFEGVWANSNSVEECRKELITVLEEWLVLKLRDQNPIPEVNGLRLEIREVAVG